ncbi:hypothetical protein DLAC_03618 [Tieghemostelium lacteum]|uniref:Uncharacterized protein n=1 Tax=Tieghemostelium lacteum TaxID=361077 RepID=A0A152A0T8_TIELA|nr:hypothetical protein DLAC_03618 [Tieghemostelium lacteum]|eukprot:KYQ99680.1 hypothetical protein DLAC_03618 [Tieghemostelium lacteum]
MFLGTYHDNIEKEIQSNLDVSYFLSLKTVQDGEDQIKAKADSYFIQLLSYHATPDNITGLKGLGIKRVTELSDRLYDIIASDIDASNFYIEFSKYWVPFTMFNSPDLQNKDYMKLFKKKYPQAIGNFEKKIVEINKKYGATPAKQQALLYSHALVETYPEIIFYLNSQTAKNKFSTKLLEYVRETDYISDWAKTVTYDTFPVEFNAMKSLIDFIDPTMETSNQVLMQFIGQYVLYQFQKGNKMTDAILTDNIRKILDEIENTIKTDEPENAKVKKVIDQLATILPPKIGVIGLANQFSDILLALFKTDAATLMDQTKWKNRLHTFLASKGVTADNIETGKFRLNVFFRVIQVGVLMLTGANDIFIKDGNLKPMKIVSLIAETINTGLDAATSFTLIDNFLTKKLGSFWVNTIGKAINWANPGFLKTGLQLFTTNASKIFTGSVSSFVAQRLAPAMLLVSACLSFSDYLENKDNNIQAALVDLSAGFIALSGTLATCVLLFFGMATAAGIVGAVIGLVLIAIGLVKCFVFPDKPDLDLFCELYIRDLLTPNGPEIDIPAK